MKIFCTASGRFKSLIEAIAAEQQALLRKDYGENVFASPISVIDSGGPESQKTVACVTVNNFTGAFMTEISGPILDLVPKEESEVSEVHIDTNVPVIETDVPIPDDAKKHNNRYPFKLLKVGNSFEIKGPSRKTLTRLSAQATYWSAKLKHKYVCRSTPDGARIWRVK